MSALTVTVACGAGGCGQVSVSAVVHEVVQSYQSMAAPGVRLESWLGVDVPSHVLVDPVRIKQVIANGMTNALKNTSTGSITVRVWYCSACAW